MGRQLVGFTSFASCPSPSPPSAAAAPSALSSFKGSRICLPLSGSAARALCRRQWMNTTVATMPMKTERTFESRAGSCQSILEAMIMAGAMIKSLELGTPTRDDIGSGG